MIGLCNVDKCHANKQRSRRYAFLNAQIIVISEQCMLVVYILYISTLTDLASLFIKEKEYRNWLGKVRKLRLMTLLKFASFGGSNLTRHFLNIME